MYGYGGDPAKEGLFVDKDVCEMIILEWFVRLFAIMLWEYRQ
jgi:hypothetical protein